MVKKLCVSFTSSFKFYGYSLPVSKLNWGIVMCCHIFAKSKWICNCTCAYWIKWLAQ